MIKFLDFLGIITILTWLRPTVEGNDGKASARRITLFIITVLFVLGNLQVFYVMKETALVRDVLIIDAIFILILFGIVSVDNIITIIKLKSGKEN